MYKIYRMYENENGKERFGRIRSLFKRLILPLAAEIVFLFEFRGPASQSQVSQFSKTKRRRSQHSLHFLSLLLKTPWKLENWWMTELVLNFPFKALACFQLSISLRCTPFSSQTPFDLETYCFHPLQRWVSFAEKSVDIWVEGLLQNVTWLKMVPHQRRLFFSPETLRRKKQNSHSMPQQLCWWKLLSNLHSLIKYKVHDALKHNFVENKFEHLFWQINVASAMGRNKNHNFHLEMDIFINTKQPPSWNSTPNLLSSSMALPRVNGGADCRLGGCPFKSFSLPVPFQWKFHAFCHLNW